MISINNHILLHIEIIRYLLELSTVLSNVFGIVPSEYDITIMAGKSSI